jgi:hypothetical protein
MINLVTVARTSIIEIYPVDYPHNEAPWYEVYERLMDNTYDPKNNFIELHQVNYGDMKYYYMEMDANKAPENFQQILKDGLEEMRGYLRDYGFGMTITTELI